MIRLLLSLGLLCVLCSCTAQASLPISTPMPRPSVTPVPSQIPTLEPNPTQVPSPTPASPTLTPQLTIDPLSTATPVVLPQLEIPSDDSGPPPVWLIVDDQAIPGAQGSFGYTAVDAQGQQTYIISDSGSPQSFKDMPKLRLPSETQAWLVVGSGDVATMKADVGSWEGQGETFFEEDLAPLFEQQDERVRVFELPPFASDGSRLLTVVVHFTGELHENDYAIYYWRLDV